MKLLSVNLKTPGVKLLLFFICLVILIPIFLHKTPVTEARESRSGQVVILDPPDGEKKDFYFSKGDVVEVKGEITGDVYVFANEVKVLGSVNGDLIVAAWRVGLNGSVSQDVRILAEQVNIAGTVGRNLTVIGKELSIPEDGMISGGLAGFLTDTELKGVISGEVKLSAQKHVINSHIGRNTELWGEDILIQNGSVINGDLTYHSGLNAVVEKGASISGELVKSPVTRNEFDIEILDKIKFYSRLFSYAGILVTGLVFIRLYREITNGVVDRLAKHPVKSFIAGLFALFLIPFLSLLLLVTVVGIPLSLIIILFYILTLYISKVFLSILVGKLILNNKSMFVNFISGLLVFYFLSFFSFMGWVNTTVCIMGLGAFVLFYKDFLGKNREQITKRITKPVLAK